MDKRYLLELIQKHNRGEATPEEELLLQKYDQLFGAGQDELSKYNEEKKAALKADIYKVITEKIVAAEPGTGKLRIINKSFIAKMAVAASLLVVCLTGVF